MAMEQKIHGVLARYESPSAIYEACKKVRAAGYTKWDSYTPFPVHGLDKAMGLKPSYLPWIVLCAGLSGAVLALLLMVWTSAYDYPLNIGGKPTWSIPAFIPITFEVTVLFSGLTSVFAMFAINRMPEFSHPLFSNSSFARATNDQFFIAILATDPLFSHQRTIQILRDTGAASVEVVEETI